VAALEYFGGWHVQAHSEAAPAACAYLVLITRARPLPDAPAGFERVAEVLRPAERDERTLIFRRQGTR
jgi:hypothetical protein